MKKLMSIMICAVLSIGATTAQNSKTYTGFVVDKNGNPVVGAEVMAPGGGVSTITDADGSFTIEVPFLLKKLTASYTGMGEKTLNLGEESSLVFKMNSLKKRAGFISFIGNIGFGKWDSESIGGYYDDNSTSILAGGGVMGGQLGILCDWGWYIKGMGYISVSDTYGTGSLTGGATKRLSPKAHLYFGAGAAYVYESMGFSLDLGTIFKVGNHVNVIAGLNYTNSSNKTDYYNDKYNLINVNIGVGYVF